MGELETIVLLKGNIARDFKKVCLRCGLVSRGKGKCPLMDYCSNNVEACVS